MRLLKLDDDGELSLTEFIDDNIPPYAILSHTWGADNEEVTFKDLVEGTGKTKAGYRKIRFCAEQAASDGLQYSWVDTCAIDKSSSAELSEAINSMFRWYQDAATCYVYLSDVSIDGFARDDLSFQKSRWFTRGWTLQELLAPTSVQFFSVEGKRLGDKSSLVQEIAKITGISFQALQGSPLSQFSVDERMSWAAKRKTKRQEDTAYSLLGIFNIHMPLIYGEGRQKALNRLQKKIHNATVTVLHDRQPKLSPSSTVPFRRDDDFVSRDSLDKIRQICARPASRAALVGLGGVGKSQIAIEYAYQVRDESPTTWVFWIHAGTQARFEDGYRRIAEATKMEGWDNPKANLLRLVRSWLCDESNGQWVIIIDNADDSSVFFPPLQRRSLVAGATALGQTAEPLSDFLPQSPNGSILVTSRSQDTAYRLTGSYSSIIEVKPMDEDDALALLQKKLSFHPNEREGIELVQVLDHMPLAITQAAAYITQRAPRMTVLRYIEEVCRGDDDRLLNKDVGDSRRDGKASNSIVATWQISFEHIRRDMPTAARLLSLMSLFDRQGIPESLLQDRYGRDDNGEVNFEDDIHTLISYSLVKINAEGCEFEMHRLVQFSTRKWLELNQELEQWKRSYVTLMDDNYPVGRHENWAMCQALFPHAQAVVRCQPDDAKALEAWASVLFKAAWYASEMGQYDVAHRMGSAALGVRETLLGAEHPKTLNSLNSLGLVLDWQGKYNEAEALHRRALEAKRRVLGEEHLDTLTSMSSLALTYWNQGRWEAAEELNVQVVEMRKKKLGADHPETLSSMTNLSLVYRNQGRWEAAEELQVQVMEISKKKLGADHPETLSCMAGLASTYLDQGRWEAAEELDVQVVEMRKKMLGEDHPDTLHSISNLASTYWNQGRWEAAEELDVQVMEMRKKMLGEDHPDTLNSISNLASTYKNQGRWEAAEELQVQVMEMRKKKLGEDHPNTLNSISNLASTYWNQGRWEAAEELQVPVMEMRKKMLGESHPDTLISMNNLAFTWKTQGRDVEAIGLMRECVRLRYQILGISHPDSVSSSTALAEWENDATER